MNNIYLWLAAFPIGVAIGFTRLMARRLPLVIAGLLIIAYLAFLAFFFVSSGTLSCPHCNAGESWDRSKLFDVVASWSGILVGLALTGIAMGDAAADLFGDDGKT